MASVKPKTTRCSGPMIDRIATCCNGGVGAPSPPGPRSARLRPRSAAGRPHRSLGAFHRRPAGYQQNGCSIVHRWPADVMLATHQERSTSHVARPRPVLLRLARRLRHRRGTEPRRPVRPRRRAAARVDVRHQVVARDGRPARRHRRHRRHLLAAVRYRDRRRDHGCRQVRPARMARGPGVEGLVGSEPAVPHADLRPHPPPAPADRDGGRHDLPLPQRAAGRGARDGPRGRGRPGRAHRRRTRR